MDWEHARNGAIRRVRCRGPTREDAEDIVHDAVVSVLSYCPDAAMAGERTVSGARLAAAAHFGARSHRRRLILAEARGRIAA